MTAAFSRPAFGQAEVERFRAAIRECLGLQFDDGKLDYLANILRQRLEARRSTCTAYWEALASTSRSEIRTLAACLTVSETYFFRNLHHFQALTELALPERFQARARNRKLRLLSAGCASGEEAYSMAITIRDHFPEAAGWDVAIAGIDLNPAMIEKARQGRYTAWSLRETPAETRARYFHGENGEFSLDGAIRGMASFEEGNLSESVGWEGGEAFDVIFCRNVVMYLLPERMQAVIERLTQALAPGGFLFLGHAETLRGLSHDFQLRHTHETFYYQKRGQPPRLHATGRPSSSAAAPLAEAPPAGESWVDAIQAASERIQHLADECSQPPLPVAAPPGRKLPTPAMGSARGPAMGIALELLRQEKFGEALQALGELPMDTTIDADAQLLRAALLTHCGDLRAAELVCGQLLAGDDLNAGAHYLMALCREHAGDLDGAAEEDRLAVHLDPGFAIAHFHLGRLAQRTGDWSTAREELQQAAALLPREDAARILLFGGGFSREALLAFSRAQWRACGGAA